MAGFSTQNISIQRIRREADPKSRMFDWILVALLHSEVPDYLNGKRIPILEDDRLANVPKSAESGDVLWQLDNYPVHYLMRNVQANVEPTLNSCFNTEQNVLDEKDLALQDIFTARRQIVESIFIQVKKDYAKNPDAIYIKHVP